MVLRHTLKKLCFLVSESKIVSSSGSSGSRPLPNYLTKWTNIYNDTKWNNDYTALGYSTKPTHFVVNDCGKLVPRHIDCLKSVPKYYK